MLYDRAVQILILSVILLGCSSQDAEEAGLTDTPELVTEEPMPEADVEVAESPVEKGMALIPAGTFTMGSSDGYAHEAPKHEVKLDSFLMDTHEVTNEEFAQFVEETGFVSEAEEWKWSIIFAPDNSPGQRVPGAEWWKRGDGATWRHPNGKGTDIEGLDKYPVVQVSWNDAAAYAKWAGKRLPTEAEWEYAARGGLKDTPYAWGFDFAPDGKQQANTWNGEFPIEDSGEDGYEGLAPVGQYDSNGYGLYDMAGNVWEWVGDWYGANYYSESPTENPKGPNIGFERVHRGGSFMCASNYCMGYRVSHRNKSGVDSGLPHVGFRCVKSVSEE